MYTVKNIDNSNEAHSVLALVSDFGTILIEQLPYFFPEKDRNKNFMAIVNHLVTTKQVSRADNIITNNHNVNYDSTMIDCIWAMIFIAEKFGKELPINEQLSQRFTGSGAELINFILNSSNICKVMPLFHSADETNLLFANEKYLSMDKKKMESDTNMYFIVVNDKKELVFLRDSNISIPYRVVFLEKSENVRPNFKIMKPSQR